MMRRRDVVAGLAAGVAAGVAGAAFLPSRVVAAGVSPAEAEVKALFAREGPAAAFVCRRWDRKRWGLRRARRWAWARSMFASRPIPHSRSGIR